MTCTRTNPSVYIFIIFLHFYSHRSNKRLTATRVVRPSHSPSHSPIRSTSHSHSPRRSRSPSRRCSRGREVPRDLEVLYCVLCRGYHGLRFCKNFKRMTVGRRREVVSNLGYCFNCLARSDSHNYCTSEEACRRCDQLHHTLLHIPSGQERREALSATIATARTQWQHQQRRPRRQTYPRSRQPTSS